MEWVEGSRMFILWLLTILGGAIALASLRKQLTQNEDLIDRLMRRMDRLEREGGVAPPDAAPIPEAQSPAARVAAMASRLPVARVVAEPPPTEEAPSEEVPTVEPAPVATAPSPPPPTLTPAVARTVSAPVLKAPSPWQDRPATEAEPAPVREKLTLEALIGGKLPIWVGSIALILSAFFLVRYSIEQGLLGPGVRSLMAAIFGLGLLAASEAARRIPRFADDPRVGQALAGAGIASLYGTLYMAGQLYALISPTAAFLLMAAVTAGALALSLRHGAPTAILGLVGGFTAPFLGGPSSSVIPLLVYLGLLIAGLFAVAIQRGWMWLALAATGGGIVWSLGLLAADVAGIGPALGVFIAALALAAAMFLPRTGGHDPRIRMLPLVAGFVQLALFAPSIDFGSTGWALYALLSGAAMYLGWKDDRLMPATAAALALVLILLGGAFMQESALAPWAAIGMTALFAIPGHVLARQDQGKPWWSVLALGGTAGPLLAARMTEGRFLLSDKIWALVFVAAAIICATLSFRAKGEGREDWKADTNLAGGAIAAGLLGLAAINLSAPSLWFPLAMMALGVGLAAWAATTKDRVLRATSLGFAGLALLPWLWEFVNEDTLAPSLVTRTGLPDIQPLLALVVGPIAALGAVAWFHRGQKADQVLRWAVLGFAALLVLALAPFDWHAVALAAVLAGALALRPQVLIPRYGEEAWLALTAAWMLVGFEPFFGILAMSLTGLVAHYDDLPTLGLMVINLTLPGLILGGVWWLARREPKVEFDRALIALGGSAVLASLYALAKQPLAIGTDEAFAAWGFIERAVLTQALLAGGIALLWKGPESLRRASCAILALGAARYIWFDLLILNPAFVDQWVGSWPIANAATIHAGLTALWCWLAAKKISTPPVVEVGLRNASLLLTIAAVAITVRQALQGAGLATPAMSNAETYGYSIAFLGLSLLWLWRGISGGSRWLRIAGLGLLTIVTLKVFLIDAAALEGLLRVLSFMGLGGALIGIGWVYTKVLAKEADDAKDELPA
jgi:uncharacterized membrane protein